MSENGEIGSAGWRILIGWNSITKPATGLSRHATPGSTDASSSLSGRQESTLFHRLCCEKVAPAGQFEVAGRVAVTCRHDRSAEHSLSRSAERQLRLRGSHRPQRLFPDGA